MRRAETPKADQKTHPNGPWMLFTASHARQPAHQGKAGAKAKKTGARFPERLSVLVGRVGFEPTTN
jgi:hypothetical protein